MKKQKKSFHLPTFQRISLWLRRREVHEQKSILPTRFALHEKEPRALALTLSQSGYSKTSYPIGGSLRPVPVSQVLNKAGTQDSQSRHQTDIDHSSTIFYLSNTPTLSTLPLYQSGDIPNGERLWKNFFLLRGFTSSLTTTLHISFLPLQNNNTTSNTTP